MPGGAVEAPVPQPSHNFLASLASAPTSSEICVLVRPAFEEMDFGIVNFGKAGQPRVAIYAAGILLSLALMIIAYRLRLHPLSRYPGPLAAKLTSGYGAYHAWYRRSHVVTYENLQKYGPVIRAAPDRLIFNTVTAIQDIYSNSRVAKGRAYAGIRQDPSQPNIFNATDKATHRQRRKVVAPLISDRGMRAFEPDMSREVDVFLRLLLRSSQAGKLVNVTQRCENIAVDVVGHLSFGYALRSQTEPLHRRVVHGIKARASRTSVLFAWPGLRAVFDLLELAVPLVPGGVGARYNAAVAGWHESVRTMIGARMAMPRDAKRDFYAQAASQDDAGPVLTEQLWAESLLLVAAGGSTTSTALTATFFYLSRNPEARARLADEIRSSFASGAEIAQGPRLAGCKYLRAVLDETLRLAPGTVSLWREQEAASVAAGEEWVVDGHVIPPGTQVAINTFSLMRNAEYFDEPMEFRPERWLEAEGVDTEEEKTARAVMRKAFVPFILGDRACAGKAMAYLELSLVVARTVWYFDFEKAPGEAARLGEADGEPRHFQMRDGIVVAHDGPILMFKPRGEYWRDLEGREA